MFLWDWPPSSLERSRSTRLTSTLSFGTTSRPTRTPASCGTWLTVIDLRVSRRSAGLVGLVLRLGLGTTDRVRCSRRSMVSTWWSSCHSAMPFEGESRGPRSDTGSWVLLSEKCTRSWLYLQNSAEGRWNNCKVSSHYSLQILTRAFIRQCFYSFGDCFRYEQRPRLLW
jgi:hypothetical protein